MEESPRLKDRPSEASRLRKLFFWRRLSRLQMAVLIAAVILVVLLLAMFLRPSKKGDYSATVFTAKKSDLVISVLEGGTVTAANSFEIKCGVEGQTTIISVVPDGYVITEEDVKNGKVLLELDSSKLREQAIQQNIAFQDAAAAYTQAKEQLEIQKNQNESDIGAADLQVEVARMDLEKFLGSELTEPVLAGKVDFRELVAGPMESKTAGDFLRKIHLGGVASQTWEKLQSDIDLAAAQFANQETTYEWSRKLGPKIGPEVQIIADADKILADNLGRKWPDESLTGAGYVHSTDVEKDALLLKTAKSAMDQARLSRDIFLRYDFVKETRAFLSAYTEATRQLERTKAKTRSALAMAEVNLKTREESLKIQQEHLDRVNNQVAACTIHATKSGMVVYPARNDENRIAEGAVVRERQVILTIPDFSAMEVTVRVHEASVDQVKRGQQVKIVVDALPDMTLWGEVENVASMPEELNWLNPDVMVFRTTVALKNAPVFLKPGMSAQAEIMVDTVADAIVVPLQAVFNHNGQNLCCVLNGNVIEPRLIQTGRFNTKFIQVTGGISEGTQVLLSQPPIADAVLAKLVSRQAPAKGDAEAASAVRRDQNVSTSEATYGPRQANKSSKVDQHPIAKPHEDGPPASGRANTAAASPEGRRGDASTQGRDQMKPRAGQTPGAQEGAADQGVPH
jgi:RND family efflux transporter MFP subunit